MNPKHRRIALLKASGMSNKEVARIVGMSDGSVAVMCSTRRLNLPKRHLLHDLPPHIVDWLITNTPDGASIADTVRSILVDAYNDDTSAP